MRQKIWRIFFIREVREIKEIREISDYNNSLKSVDGRRSTVDG